MRSQNVTAKVFMKEHGAISQFHRCAKPRNKDGHTYKEKCSIHVVYDTTDTFERNGTCAYATRQLLVWIPVKKVQP